MRTIALSVIVGMTALMMLAPYSGVASAQINSGVAAIGVATGGPFSLVKGGFGHGGFGFGRGFGFYGGWGWPYGGYGYSGYGSGFYDYPNSGTRREPGKTCVWSGYEWTCYKFDNNYRYY